MSYLRFRGVTKCPAPRLAPYPRQLKILSRVVGWSPIECPYNNWWPGFHDGGINHEKDTVEASAKEIALALSPKLGGDKAKAKGGIVWIWKIAQGKGKQ